MRHNPDIRIHSKPAFRGRPGFTLVELVLATAISAIVMSILAVCLSFALRAWESTQNKKPDLSAALVSILRSQLAEFDPTPVQFEDKKFAIFNGQSTSLSFATDHSVKAISGGVPVIARYVYDAKAKVLYYAEIPFDPYHGERLKEFMSLEPNTSPNAAIRFYTIEIDDFSLSYMGGEKSSSYIDKWDSTEDLPTSVLIKWSTPGAGNFAQAIELNVPFTIETDQQSKKAVGL